MLIVPFLFRSLDCVVVCCKFRDSCEREIVHLRFSFYVVIFFCSSFNV